MKKRFLSLFCVLALCLGLLPTTALADAVVVIPPEGGDGDISVVVPPDESGNVTVIVPGQDGGDIVVVIPPEEEEAPVIGDVVNFAGHEWYIIGDETAGVIAPEGCYTLFAKNNDFGSTAYWAGDFGDRWSTYAINYSGSDLQKAMEEIADGFSETNKAAIVPRDLDEDDDIWGDPVEDQLLWPIGGDRSISNEVGYVTGEAGLIGESIRQFETIYWGRTGTKSNSTGATDEFIEPSPEPGEPTPTPTPVPTPAPPYIDKTNSYSVIAYNADGSEKWDGTAGVLSGSFATFANNSFAIRPALYVKAEAVTGGAEASPVIGDTVSFAGHEWYLIGTGLGGVTAPAGCYTLFAKYDDFGSTAFRANGGGKYIDGAYNYKDSDLYNKMNAIADEFSIEDKANIVARATLDEIKGDPVTNQLLWPIGSELDKNTCRGVGGEAALIDQSIRQFDAIYWGRTGIFSIDNPDVSVDNTYTVIAYATDGSERWEKTMGVSGEYASTATNEFAVRPALYVKAEEVGAPKVTVPLTGGKVYFGSQDWYIVGMGDTGLVPGPSKTVTLFADSIVEGQYATTDIHYSQGDLCAVMNNLGASLNLSAQAQSLISSRTLTAADEITGDPVTTPFWPLSKSEFEAIQAENSSLLMGDAWPYWLRTKASSEWALYQTVYAGDTDGTLTQNSTPSSNFGVRPAFYLDLSTLFFAAGETSMGSSEGGSPVKLMPPGTDSSQKRWNFVMYDSKNLSLSMSAVQGQSSQSLTFQYNGTGGTKHFLAYVLEQDGVPLYYGKAANLIDSGTGTVTVPLLGSSSKLEDGDYTMRFYVEDRTDGIYFASDTVDLKISVADGAVSITDMRDVAVHTHDFSGELKYDENNHWRECACGAKATPQAHEYSGNEDKTCMYCDYERKVDHQHTLQWLFSSGAGHWQQCIFCNEIMTSVEPHVYDDDQDTICNVCGYKRLPPHTHDFGWDFDAFAHWQECSCGEKTVAEAHSYDGDQDAECNICGYEREISHTHDFGTDWESDAFNHWHKCSTCGAKTAEAAHSYGDDQDTTCNICGYVRDLSHTHTYSNSWDCDTISHWHECSCGARSAEAAHVYDNDLDTECNICKFKREISHVHQGVLVSGTPATCTQEGSKAYYTCTCEQAFEDEACTKPIEDLDSWKVIPATDHTWTESYLAENADAQKHYHVCTVCNVKDEGEAHTWNAESATEQNDKHCTICNYVAEEQLEHTHTYGTEWKSDADAHWHECSCGEKADIAAHSYDNDQDSTCNICGYERQITPPVSQVYTVTFNANGGSVSQSSAVTTDGKLTSLPTPICAGYDFVGWYTAASGGQPVTTGTVFTGDTTLYAHWSVRESGGGGGGSSSTTEIERHPDGSTTTTVTKPDGSTTETTRHPDGSSEVVETAKDGTVTTTTTDTEGNQTQVVKNTDGSSQTTVDNRDGSGSVTVTDADGRVVSEATLSETAVAAARASGEPVALPMPAIPVTADRERASTVTVELPGGASAPVEIPVEDVTPGTVAVLIRADGTEEVLKASLPTENGVTVTLSDGDTVKLVDNSKEFSDVSDSYWAADMIDFATSRELFAGTAVDTFAPDETMSRAMIVTVLARLEGVDTATGDTWYEAGRQWAMANGVSDGTNMEQGLSRQQLATMLWRYAQAKGYDVSIGENTNILSYTDVADLSEYAISAMQWAVGAGIINGTGDGSTLTPQGPATRAQVATMLMRFCEEYMTW